MAINIKIGGDAPEEETNPVEKIKKRPQAKAKIKARKTLGGDIVLYDHEDLDVIVQPTKNKVVVFPKEQADETIHASQLRLLDFLSKKGIIEKESIQGGHIFNSYEANIQEPNEDIDPVQVAVYAIHKFIMKEKPYSIFKKEQEDREEKRLTEPSEEDSTELGEVPGDRAKGSMRPGLFYRYYGLANYWFEE